MNVPQLSASQFLLLSGLLDGKPRRICRLAERVNWPKTRQVARGDLQHMYSWGMLNRYRAPGNKTFVLYQITDYGREYFREVLDFYLHTARASSQLPDYEPDNPFPEPTGPQLRKPTPDEEEAILSMANERLKIAMQLLRVLDCLPAHLVELDIEDIDLHASEIEFLGEAFPISRELCDGIERLIGSRSYGPLFIGKISGCRVQPNYFNTQFRRCRERLGLPDNVTICGEHWRILRSTIKRKNRCTL